MKRATPRVLPGIPILFLTILLPACSDNTAGLDNAAGAPATLMVINTTCDPGPCIPLAIRGIIPKFSVPGQPPAGFLAVGTVDSASACLKIPASDSLVVIGPSDTTVIRWTQDDDVVLTASNALSMSALNLPISQTDEFTPASAPGWRVTFPGDSGRAVVERAVSCAP